MVSAKALILGSGAEENEHNNGFCSITRLCRARPREWGEACLQTAGYPSFVALKRASHVPFTYQDPKSSE